MRSPPLGCNSGAPLVERLRHVQSAAWGPNQSESVHRDRAATRCALSAATLLTWTTDGGWRWAVGGEEEIQGVGCRCERSWSRSDAWRAGHDLAWGEMRISTPAGPALHPTSDSPTRETLESKDRCRRPWWSPPPPPPPLRVGVCIGMHRADSITFKSGAGCASFVGGSCIGHGVGCCTW